MWKSCQEHAKKLQLSIALLALLIPSTDLCAQPATVDAQPKSVDRDWISDHLDDLVRVYRDLHAHPELSFKEEKTAARIAKELDEMGVDVTSNVGGHGVVGVFRNGAGKTLMLRADLDGLPVREQTELVYASQQTTIGATGSEVGVMHACGHDIHMTNFVGVTKYLIEHKGDWTGTLLLVAQPAEERGAGAKAMLKDGLFKRFPRPDYALAYHVDASLRTGDISFLAGYQQANVDSVDITVKGRGGHGAYPHTTIDPIVQAAQLVLALQTIVSREVDPIEPAVVTVGSIHGGSKHNVIDDDCHLQLTVRSYSSEVRKQLHTAIKRIAKGVATTCGAPDPVVDISEGTPSLLNDADLANRLRPVLVATLGKDHVHKSTPSMGGEDFSRYGQEGVPILMIRLGSVNEQRLKRFETLGVPGPSLHSPRYYPDARETLNCSVLAMAAAALDLLVPN